MFYSDEKTVLLIDGPNFYAANKAVGLDADFRLMLDYFQDNSALIRAYYYTALVEDAEYSTLRPLVDWLSYNGYCVVTKLAKEYTDSTGRRKVKGSLDVELTVQALTLTDRIDHFVLFSGDSNFVCLLEALQNKGCKVTVISTLESGIVADAMRRQADTFLDIKNLTEFMKPPKSKTTQDA